MADPHQNSHVLVGIVQKLIELVDLIGIARQAKAQPTSTLDLGINGASLTGNFWYNGKQPTNSDKSAPDPADC